MIGTAATRPGYALDSSRRDLSMGLQPMPRTVSKQTRTIILTVTATLLVVGVLQNMRTVTIRFVLWDTGVPLSLFLLFVAGLGFIAGLFWRRR